MGSWPRSFALVSTMVQTPGRKRRSSEEPAEAEAARKRAGVTEGNVAAAVRRIEARMRYFQTNVELGAQLRRVEHNHSRP